MIFYLKGGGVISAIEWISFEVCGQHHVQQQGPTVIIHVWSEFEQSYRMVQLEVMCGYPECTAHAGV